ncbi:putative S-adenosyl-L-methionine-dependent methyltransferase [Paratrimastix pyriformis]|uniref:S-adenosyl-L-methionine-dependent methyltransferase n=1 Tax=Paratrimastix pyriformis TaxID=342808 RepID=A0ABQ8USH3_9EUKA|nr:putative S-adenosyl-L-methionine-dependent methyltransferase [Paratrimastix pyriformis]
MMLHSQGNYGTVEYWDERYKKAKKNLFTEWYCGMRELRPLFDPLPRTASIIHIGAGNSQLGFQLYDFGFRSIINVDISPEVIANMQQSKMTLSRQGCEWRVADVTSMAEYGNGQFDISVDKGTLDALMCSAGSAAKVELMFHEISRVLKPDGGLAMFISFGNHMKRLNHLRFGWHVREQTIDKDGRPYHIYHCTRFPARAQRPPTAAECGGAAGADPRPPSPPRAAQGPEDAAAPRSPQEHAQEHAQLSADPCLAAANS